jgi:hypothetical protein
MAENKEVPERNIGVPPVRKYANYRTLFFIHQDSGGYGFICLCFCVTIT